MKGVAFLPYSNGLSWEYMDESESEFLYDEIFVREEYFKHFIHLKNGDVIFDCGANIGIFGIYCTLQAENLTIIAIEPIPQIVEVLSRNLSLIEEESSSTFLIVSCGIGSIAMEDTFLFNLSSPGESSRNIEEYYSQNKRLNDCSDQFTKLIGTPCEEKQEPSFLKCECRISTLHEIITEHKIEKIDLLKIDVEGDELEALLGLGESWEKIKQIVIEVHNVNGRLQKITELLEFHGFIVFVEPQKTAVSSEGYLSFIPAPLELYYVYATIEKNCKLDGVV